MIQNIKSKKEVTLLLIVFIIIGIFGIAVKSFEYYHIKIISASNVNIYEHPLKISKATLTMNLNIYKIKQNIKDMILALSNKELVALIEEINHHESDVYKNLKFIEQNILEEEGLSLNKKIEELLDTWKLIHHETISLIKNAKKDDAIIIMKEKGAKHILKLEAAISKLYLYEEERISIFKNKAKSSFEILKTINILISVLFFLLFVIIAYYIIHRISRYIDKDKHIKGVLSVIRNVNQLIVREKNPQTLIQKSCDILTSTHIYSNAWIVLYDQNNQIEYIESNDISENFTTLKEKLNKSWVPHCINKTRKTESLYSLIKNTKESCSECPLSDAYKNKSAFNIALQHDEKFYGYLTLSVDTKYLYNKEELALLKEVAGDIAYALYNLANKQYLQEQEERYRFAIEGTADGVWDWNLQSNKLYFSPRWKEILGYSDDELSNNFETWKELTHPDDLGQALLKVRQAQKSTIGQYRNIHRLKHKDGHWVWIETRGKVIFDEVHKPVRMIGSHIEITQRKEAENEALRLKELYNSVIDSVDNMIFVKNSDFVYITCNSGFEKFIGKSKEQIIGKSDYDLFDKEVADFFREHDQIMLSQNKAKSNFEWVTYPDGQKVYLLTVKSPLKSAEGKILGLVGNSADFTERQHLYDLLKDAQSLAKIGSWEYDIVEDKLSCSDEVFQIYGFSNFNMKLDKKTFINRQYPDDMQKAEEVFQNSLHSQEMTIAHNRIIRYDNQEVRYVEHRWTTQYDDSKKAIKTIGTTQDITEQKAIEQALEESNRQLNSLMNSLPGMAYRCNNDEQWTMKFLSDGCEQLTGYKSADILNNHVISYKELIHPDDREMVWKKVQESLKNQRSFELDYRLLTADGEVKWVWEYGSGIYRKNSEQLIVEGVILDNNAKKQAEQELIVSNNKFEKAFNNTPNMIIITNQKTGKIYDINQTFEHILDYKKEELIGKTTFDINLWSDLKNREDYIKTLKQEGLVKNAIYTFNKKNGEEIIANVYGSIVTIDNETYILAVANDITELKKKDELMIIQSRHAAMGEMIGMIAHQWRQPLTVISINANNMLLDIALDELDESHVKKYSNKILAQTQHLSKTIDDFRNFFKPDKSVSKVKLQEVLEETYSIVKDSLTNHNIAFKTSYASESEIDAYPRELMQVFVNIINNSKDALLLHNQENAEIKVRVFEDEVYVITEICDNGSGIDEAILPKIFDPYFTTKDKKTGTGLGLYMSKMIIDDHLHGKIEVYNQHNGVCFRVKLHK